jgi:hypothetical protein
MSLYCIDQDFAEWAFGEKLWNDFMILGADIDDLFNAWNSTRGLEIEVYFTNPTDYLKNSLHAMKQAWLYHKKEDREMDKKMAKVTQQMKTAEKDIKGGKTQEGLKALKGAEKKNEKLTAYDKNVRDPKLEKCEKMEKHKSSKGSK